MSAFLTFYCLILMSATVLYSHFTTVSAEGLHFSAFHCYSSFIILNYGFLYLLNICIYYF